MSKYKLVPLEPTMEMVEAAEDAYMPFGDMTLAIQMAILVAPNPWVSVEDHLPNIYEPVLVVKDCGVGTLASISVCLMTFDGWRFSDSTDTLSEMGYRVTHWASLPEPPQSITPA